ncbi:hypothetical protein KOW79_017730 [Hemibagrus wyckioides]|uniref:Uncharacterized protein n=1 Tax=Hemibagrus wyckioides TaxID=337641 RepID=A0A9D3N9H5_9TELE|nr:hypothetical protein KOW79_017730 [Hemibagrus wyckioides]
MVLFGSSGDQNHQEHTAVFPFLAREQLQENLLRSFSSRFILGLNPQLPCSCARASPLSQRTKPFHLRAVERDYL